MGYKDEKLKGLVYTLISGLLCSSALSFVFLPSPCKYKDLCKEPMWPEHEAPKTWRNPAKA